MALAQQIQCKATRGATDTDDMLVCDACKGYANFACAGFTPETISPDGVHWFCCKPVHVLPQATETNDKPNAYSEVLEAPLVLRQRRSRSKTARLPPESEDNDSHHHDIGEQKMDTACFMTEPTCRSHKKYPACLRASVLGGCLER